MTVSSHKKKQAMEHFKDRVSGNEEGQYKVKLPNKTPTPTLGYSRDQAVRRLIQN